MTTIRFNRHEIFNRSWVDFHSKTIRLYEDSLIERGESMFNSVTNMLAGIWDGYLYAELITEAIELGMPEDILDRVKKTVNYIKSK